jgi:hypothetical protein
VGVSTALALGDGNNSVTLNNLRLAGNVRITGGTGDDSVTVTSTHIGGALQTSLGTHNGSAGNVVTIGNFTSIFGATQITGGAGKDVVNTSNVSLVGVARISLGAGENILTTGGTNFESGLAYTGLAGPDNISLGGGAVRGALSISPGDGNNTATLNAVHVHGKTTFKGGHVGSDSFFIENVTILNGTLTMNAGNGSNLLVVRNFSNATGFVYNGGADSDTVVLEQTGSAPSDFGAYVRGRVKLGAGSDLAQFSLTSYLAFSFDGGALPGGDTFNQSATASTFDLTRTGFETVNILA